MLGFKALVAKSRELTTKLELSAGPPTAAPAPPAAITTVAAPPAPTELRTEGDEFLRLQQAQMDRVLVRHHALVRSGDELSASLAQTRAKLLDEAESAQFLAQNFHLVARVRQQLGHLRGLVHKIAEDAEDVENLLAQRTEEYMAQQNAEFAARQQEELERFERQILVEKEGRKRALLEERRQKLAQAFHDDLRTYQTLATSSSQETAVPAASAKETLESIDLVVETDAEQLEAFYDSDSASETETTPRFSAPQSPEAAVLPRVGTKAAVDTADEVDPSAIPDDAGEEEEKDEEGEEEEEKETKETEAASDVATTEPSSAAETPTASASAEEQVA